MSLEQQLKELNEHPNDTVANFAADAYDLQQKLKAGQISASEYKELLADIGHTQAINESAADLETKTKLQSVMEGLVSLASAI